MSETVPELPAAPSVRARPTAFDTLLGRWRRDRGSGASGRVWISMSTVGAGVLVCMLFGVLASDHWWISDDGMIVVREVRQVLAGAGPNYNPLQRDEADTSPLWMWLLTAFTLIRRGDVAVSAVALGFALAVAGLVLALWGSSSRHRRRGVNGVLLPVGALVPVGIAGFWDFATSGLETGLSLFWLGLVWRLLVSATAETSHPRLVMVALV
ncbi:MAG: hypothetical protein JO280_11530, partial [Mycobacteriaceae bacterium]|nr:hypothetical protein [Mycobacteriaceae bacterium]